MLYNYDKGNQMKNTILITGGAGFIGSNLVKNLLDTTNHEIIVIDRDGRNVGRLERLTMDCREFTIYNDC